MKKYKHSFVITEENIDKCSEDVVSQLSSKRIEGHNITRLRLQLESILLLWHETFHDNTQCILEIKERFGHYLVRLRAAGKSVDPFSESTEETITEQSMALFNVAANLNLVRDYKYNAGINTVEFSVPKKPLGTFTKMAGAMGGGIVVGLVGNMFMSPETALMLSQDFVSPIFKAILGLISGVASVYVFISILTAICNMDNLNTASKLTKKILAAFVSLNVISVLLCALFFIGQVNFETGGGGVFYELLKNVFQLIIRIIPNNLVEPFVKRDAMQLLFLAIISGNIILIMGAKLAALRDWLNSLNLFILELLRTSCRALPLVVFFCVVNIIRTNQLGVIFKAWHMVLPVILVPLIISLVICAWGYKNKVIDFSAHKDDLKTLFILGATTGSRSPCMSTMYDICVNKLKLEKAVADIGVPLSSMFMVFQKVASILAYTCGAAVIFDIDLSVSQFIMLILCSSILVYTIPPINLGDIAVIGMLMAMVGIPEEAISMIMPFPMVLGFVHTPLVVVPTILLLAGIDKSLKKE